MSYRYDSGFGGGYDPMSCIRGASAVKLLMLVCFGIYVLGLISRMTGHFDFLAYNLALNPLWIREHFFVWQFVTSIFFHASFLHIFFNMLGLFFFGPDLEYYWGKKKFVLTFLGI